MTASWQQLIILVLLQPPKTPLLVIVLVLAVSSTIQLTRAQEPWLAGRQLQQQASEQCPGCAAGKCEVSGTAAGSTLVCSQCRGSLVLSDSVCVCPQGRYGTDNDCADCLKGAYCPGGAYTAPNTPASIPCPPGMTTAGKRAGSIRRCGKWERAAHTAKCSTSVALHAPAAAHGPCRHTRYDM